MKEGREIKYKYMSLEFIGFDKQMSEEEDGGVKKV